jgi:hypothetical protein
MTGGPGRPAVPVYEDQEFQERWLVAQRSLGSTLPGPMNWSEHRRGADPEVRIDTFARWARSLGWELPAGLSQLAGDSGQPAQLAASRVTTGPDSADSSSASALWEAERRKLWSNREYFGIGELARNLGRSTAGRLEVDEAEATRILHHLCEWYDRGEFGDDEIFVLSADPPSFAPAKQRINGEFGAEIPPLIWRESVLLRRPAVRRYLDGCGLAGAPRVLAEWDFGGGSEGAAKPEPAAAASDAITRPASLDKRTTYEMRVAEIRQQCGRVPPLQTTKSGLQGDREWAAANGIARAEIKKWRHDLLGRQSRGRPKNSTGNSPRQ